MKRKYKKALQDCFEPPAPQRKAQFLQQIQAEQSQDTATPLFFQRYPKWIRQSAMVFCAAAVQRYFFTTKGRHIHSDVSYPTDKPVYLVFGREDKGLNESLLVQHPDTCVRIPMRNTLRSLNLSNSVAIAAYEVLRQWEYPELSVEGELTQFTWE